MEEENRDDGAMGFKVACTHEQPREPGLPGCLDRTAMENTVSK